MPDEVKKITLSVDMIFKVQGFFDKLHPQDIDLSVFKNFERDTLQVGNILDSIQVERFANESAKLLTHCKNYAAVIFAFFREANRRHERVKAQVFLVDAEMEWDKKQATAEKPKNITDKIREAYVKDSDRVNEIKERLIQWEALDKWCSDTYNDITNKHNWYKKLFDRVCQKKD